MGNFRNVLLKGIGLIIVIGIGALLAYQIENWSEERAAREAKVASLENLLIELNTNKERIEQKLNEDVKTTFESLLEIIQISGPSAKPIEESDFLDLVHNSLGDLRIAFSKAVLSDMLVSGQLVNIENDECRIRLGEWLANIENPISNMTKTRERLLDYLSKRISFIDMDRNDEFLKQYNMEGYTAFKVDTKAILADLEYQNICEDHLWQVRNVTLYFESLLNDIDQLEKLISKELNRE